MQTLLTRAILFLFFLLMGYTTDLSAQVTFQVGHETGFQGDLVCVPVTVSNFNDVIALQFSLEWDENELFFDGLTLILNPEIPWLSFANFFLEFNNKIGVSSGPFEQGLTLPDGTVLFTLCLQVLNSCGPSAIEEIDIPAPLGVSGVGGVPLESQIIPGSINILRTDLIQSITPDTAICGGDNLQLQVIAPEAISYQWSTNGNDALSCNDCPNPIVESPFDEAIYSVTVTDAAGCQQIDQVLVNVHQYLDFGLLLFSNSPVCSGGTLAFEPNIFDAQSYLWTGPNFTSTLSNPTITDVGFAEAGTYTFEGVDDIGCEVSAEFDVTINPELFLVMEITDASCLNSSDGQLIVTIIGGTFPYTYDLNNPGPGDDPDLFNLSPGSYTITVTDGIGCTVSDAFTVGSQSTSEWTATLDRSDCTNGFDYLTLQGPIPSDGYAYSLDGGITFNPIPTGNILIDSAASIDLAILDPGGCIQSVDPALIEVLEFQLSTQTITPAYCNSSMDGSVTFESSNGLPVSFEWVFNGFMPPNINPNQLFPGHYEVTALSDQACTATAIFDVPFTNSISFELDFSPQVSCPNDETTLSLVSASGGVDPDFEDYFLSVNGAVVANGNASVDLAPGQYVISINDSSCYVDTLIEITATSDLAIGDTQIEQLSCLGDPGSITVIPFGGTGPYLYTWWDGETTSENSHPVTMPGSYGVTITDSEGCQVAAESILVVEGPFVEVNPDTVICLGEPIQLGVTSSSNYTYQWAPAVGLNNAFLNNPTAQPTETTTYTVTVTDENGCSNLGSITVTVFDCNWYISDTIAIGDTTTWCDPTAGPIGFQVNQILDEPLGFISYHTTIGSNCIDFIGQQAGADTMIVELCYGTGSPCFPLIIDILVTETPVWPGDTDNNGVVDNFDVLNIGLAIDSSGPIRPDASLAWTAQPAPGWLYATPDGNNYKHSDTDGNGFINLNDTLAINLNWGEVHQFTNENPDENRLEIDVPFYLQPDTIIEGQTINLPIILGTSEVPAEEVYGLAFSLVYNPEIIAMNSAFVDLNSSWLGTLNTDLFILQKDFHSQGRTDIGLSRTNGINVSGSGAIGQFIVTIEDDILLWGHSDNRNELVTEFSIENVRLINFQGEEIPVDPQSTIAEIINSQSDPEIDRQILLSPNPAKDNLHIQAPGIRFTSISLYNSMGQKVLEKTDFNQQEMNIYGLSPGSYLVYLQTDKGVYHRKLIIGK